jgi:5'-3' exonuclease
VDALASPCAEKGRVLSGPAFTADDALASAAELAARDPAVEKVCIWSVDKDFAQCLRGDRVVQMSRRANEIIDAAGVRAKFGVNPP